MQTPRAWTEHARRLLAAPRLQSSQADPPRLLLPELAPALFAHLDTEFVGSPLDALPRRVALVIRDALELVETGDRITHMAGVIERLLALFGKRELIFVEAVALL